MERTYVVDAAPDRALPGADAHRHHGSRSGIRAPARSAREGKKLSKRDPQSNLFLHRDRGFIPEGLLNYLALLGWSIADDRDVFSLDEMVAAFDVVDVNSIRPASIRRRPTR